MSTVKKRTPKKSTARRPMAKKALYGVLYVDSETREKVYTLISAASEKDARLGVLWFDPGRSPHHKILKVRKGPIPAAQRTGYIYIGRTPAS